MVYQTSGAENRHFCNMSARIDDHINIHLSNFWLEMQYSAVMGVSKMAFFVGRQWKMTKTGMKMMHIVVVQFRILHSAAMIFSWSRGAVLTAGFVNEK